MAMTAIGQAVLTAASEYMIGRAAIAVENQIEKAGTAIIDTVESGVGLAVDAVGETAIAGASVVGAIIDVWA